MRNQQDTVNVSPKSTCAKAGQAVDEWEIMEGEEEEELEEEGRIIKGPKAIYKPSQEEWDNHMKSHIPFRRWCPYCVKGRCKSGAHQSLKKTEDEKEKEVPVISFDYMFPKKGDSKELGIESLPIIGGIDRKRKSYMAHMVPEK